MIKPQMRKKGINIEITLASDVGIIEADEVRLKQVIYNLLTNAVKFTEAGKRVGIEAHTEEEWAVIEVWDEGIGIAVEDQQRVFAPFEQVEQSDSEKRGGAGLGLAISRRLIEAHGGTLTVRSERGKGSRFRILLPGVLISGKKGGPEERSEETQSAGPASPAGKTILVVEDNETNRALISATLERLGYAVKTEQLGRDGVATAVEGEVDLVLMDIGLPDMGGVDAMKQIKAKATRSIPILALTAYAMRGDEERLLAEGFDGYISKPVDIEAIGEEIGRNLV